MFFMNRQMPSLAAGFFDLAILILGVIWTNYVLANLDFVYLFTIPEYIVWNNGKCGV